MTYHFTEGTTSIEFFHGDMHTFSIRADKVLNTWADMKEVVGRFEADRTQFDYTDYFGHAKFHKAAREYTVQVVREEAFNVLAFEYQGQEYKIETKKFSTVSKVRKSADKILVDKVVWYKCLVDDATGEVLGKGEVTNEHDNLTDHFLL